MKLELPPRLVDATIGLSVFTAVLTGVVGLVTGQPRDWWVFALHGIGGLVLVVLLFWKLRRVEPRVTSGRWNRRVVVSVLLTLTAVAALGTGIAWVFGFDVDVLLWNLMNVHILFGLLVVPLLAVHLLFRFRLPESTDFEGRRTAIQYVGLAGVGVLAYSAQSAVNGILNTAGAKRRFTGSREAGSFAGNAFPTTIWMLDDPDPIDADQYSLSITGAVASPIDLDHEEVQAFDDEHTALLDCTSGWYTEQDWTGIRVGRLLNRVDPEAEARYVTFRSVTGYRWTLPIDEARDALLATGVGDERLTHGHGAPVRLVAPDRRGFQWVKWVEQVEVRTDPDPGQLAAIFLSGFD